VQAERKAGEPKAKGGNPSLSQCNEPKKSNLNLIPNPEKNDP
jgi:hypothetical protein